jgi:four helix bundle protein
MKSHHDLDVWRGSIALAKTIYELTSQFPKQETYGLTAQIRRAAVSIASNIAEGAARQGTKEFVQFLYAAVGSASELDTQLEIAKAVEMVSNDAAGKAQGDVTRILKMLRGLIRSLQAPGAA